MKRAISIMLVAAMCMSLFGSAVLAVPSKVQIHIDGDKPEGTVQVSIGDEIKETGESNGEHITIGRDPSELEGLVGETVVVAEEDGDVFEGVLEQRGNGNDNDNENGTDNYWVTLTKQDTEEPEPEEKNITVNYVDTEGSVIADSNTVTVDKNTDTAEWANEERPEIPGTIVKDGGKYVKTNVTVDGDTVTVVYEKQEEQIDVDAIQVIMSDGVKEMYNDLKGAKWVHVDNDKSAKGYYEMGLNLWNDNSYDCTEDDITGVTMSSALMGSPKLYFSMDKDNDIFAKVEVSYGKTYDPADLAQIGKQYDTMFLYCQLVSERDGEVDPDPEKQEMDYTVTAHYYEVRNGVKSLIGIESYDGTFCGEEGESIRADVNAYNTYGGRTYEFDADNENNEETIEISKDASKNQFVLYYKIVIEEKNITVNYVDTEDNKIADSNTVTVDKNTDTEEWANESRSEIPETIMKDGDKYVKVDVIVDGDTVTVVYEKQEEERKVDAIQVIMSDGVKEMYEDLSVLEAGRYTHVDNNKSVKGYYEMGMNLWNDNSYNCTVEDVTGVSMGKNLDEAVMYFPMDKDNGIFAKVEVSYGKTYHPADIFHLFGTYDTMFLYCQLVSERDGEVLPETAEYTVKANYLTLDENGRIIESAANIEVAKGTADVGSTVTVNPDDYKSYNGKDYTFHSAAAGTSIVIVKGINEIVLNYNRTEQATADMVSYKIVTHYKTNLANGTSVTDTAEFVMQGKVGMDVVVDPNNYKTYGGVEYALDADNVGNTPDFTITVDEDITKNIITINYERTEQATADMVNYKIVAHYKTNLANGTSVTDTAEFVMQGKVGMDVVVDPNNYKTYGGVEYALDDDNYGNTPDFTITVDEDITKNIITINYERDEQAAEKAEYKVVANYLTLDENGRITDSAANVKVDSGEAEVGSTVTVHPAKYTVYDGNAYTFHSAAAGTSIVIVKGINEIVLNYNRTVDGGSGNPDEVDYKVVAYYKTVNGGSSDIVSVVLKEGKGKVGDVITIDPADYLKNGGFEFTLDKDNVGNTEGFAITLGENSNLNILNVNYIRDITDDGTNPGGGDDGDEDITDPEVPGTDPEIPGDGDEDITDPEVPGTDPEIPGDGEDITDPEVPTTNPDLPKTGGMTGFALLAAGLAATAAGVVIRKR